MIRYLLEYLEFDYSQNLYNTPEEWLAAKNKFSHPIFPNMPYLIDDSVRITESAAIEEYLILKSGKFLLNGKDAKAVARTQMLLSFLRELWQSISDMCFDPNFLETRKKKFPTFREQVLKVQKFLKDKKYLGGGVITHPDFHLYEILQYLMRIFPNQY